MLDGRLNFSKAMRQAAETFRPDLLHGHAENGGAHRRHRFSKRWAEGKARAEVSRADSPPLPPKPKATGRAIALAENGRSARFTLFISPAMRRWKKFREARDRGFAPPTRKGNVPAISVISRSKIWMAARDFEGAKYVFTPPLREGNGTRKKLWQGLARRTRCKSFSTDHCPFCFKEQKRDGQKTISPQIPKWWPRHRASPKPDLHRLACTANALA